MTFKESGSESALAGKETLLERFHNFHDYLCLLGKHIERIHDNLDEIEVSLRETRNEQRSTIETNKKEVNQLKEISVVKTEVDTLLRDLNETIKGAFPTLVFMNDLTK